MAKKGEGAGGIYFLKGGTTPEGGRNRTFVHMKNYAPVDGINMQMGCRDFHLSPATALFLWQPIKSILRLFQQQPVFRKLLLSSFNDVGGGLAGESWIG
jgi:hypothetical protein